MFQTPPVLNALSHEQNPIQYLNAYGLASGFPANQGVKLKEYWMYFEAKQRREWWIIYRQGGRMLTRKAIYNYAQSHLFGVVSCHA